MPTRRRNGASSRRRWMPSWSPSAGAASGPSRRAISSTASWRRRSHPTNCWSRRACRYCRPPSRFGFAEFSRRPGDYALAMALAVLEIEGGVITNPRLGIGGAEACPRRLAAAEAVLAGAAPSRSGVPRGGRDRRRCDRAARRSASRRAIPARAGRGDGRAGARRGLRMTGAHDRDRDRADGERPGLRAARGAAPHPARRDPRRLRADRHAYGLRARRLRRLHGIARRRAGARLPDLRGAGRGQRDPHRRGVGGGR